MTPIIPMKIVNQRALWGRFLAGVLIGTALGVMIEQTSADPPVPPVGITEVIVRVGSHLCRANEGLKTVYRHGRASQTYSFRCRDTAEFNSIPVTQRPIPSRAVLQREEPPHD